MKTLKQLLELKKPSPTVPYEKDSETSLTPKAPDEKRFKDKHVVDVKQDVAGNKDDVYKATNVKAYDRAASNHGYDDASGIAAYESKQMKTLGQILAERHMTSAEKKKREDIAQGIEKSNPGMAMSKKMAIATSKAMKEDVDHLVESEEAHAQFQKYHEDTAKILKHIHTGLSKHYDNVTHKKNYGGGQAHWGHVGDIKHIHRQLQDIHDSLLQTGEYAKPPKAIREGYELFDVFEDGFREEVVTVFESLSEDHQQTIIEMIEAEHYDTVVEIVKEVVNG